MSPFYNKFNFYQVLSWFWISIFWYCVEISADFVKFFSNNIINYLFIFIFCYSSEDSLEPKKPKVTPTDSVDYIEELISSEEKSQDLYSAPKPSLQDEIFEEQRQTWFLIG